MDKQELVDLVDRNFSISKISEHTNKSKTTVRYWLKKYHLKTNVVKNDDKKVCPKCNTEKSKSDFYKRRNGRNCSPYCKPCTSIQTIDRQRKLKSKCVEYLGGKCQYCGYSKSMNALEFHHVDPDKKDFEISKYKRYVFNDKVKKELDTCILLCSNCHREEHERIFKIKGRAPT